MGDPFQLWSKQDARPLVTVSQSAIDGYHVEVTPNRLMSERELSGRPGALAHASRLRDLYGWPVLDLTFGLTDAA